MAIEDKNCNYYANPITASVYRKVNCATIAITTARRANYLLVFYLHDCNDYDNVTSF